MLSIITSGVGRAQRRILNSRTALQKMADTNALAGAAVLRWIDENFKGEGEPTGQRWTELTPGTIARRRGGKNKGAVKARILQDTGNLRRNWKVQATDDKVIVESQMPYARDHHYGNPAKRLPARPILPTKNQVMPRLLKIYKAKVRQIIR